MATFDVRGTSAVTASDLKADPDIEILNPELHIATLNKDGEFRAEIEVGAGRGYVSAENQATRTADRRAAGRLHVLAGDEGQLRGGEHPDRPAHRLRQALARDLDGRQRDSVGRARVRRQDPEGSLRLFVHFEEEIEEEVEEEVDEEFLRIKALLERSVEELELSVRSSNCLKAANIKTIGDLVTKSEGEMLKYRNFGRKSLKEIADILANMNLHFGMDVPSTSSARRSKRREGRRPRERHGGGSRRP